MRKGIFLCLGLITLVNVFSQQLSKTDQAKAEPEGKFYCWAIEPSQKPKDWLNYLERNIVLDSAECEKIPPGCYRAIIQFVVSREGYIEQAQIHTDPGFGLGQKALAVINNFKGRWIPEKMNGRFVKTYRRQPIVYSIEKDEDKNEKQETVCAESEPGTAIP